MDSVVGKLLVVVRIVPLVPLFGFSGGDSVVVFACRGG